ncbi:hypothetical protein ACVIGB_008562 [Bradyrhizobium sp. USDA 4341]
MPDNVGAAAIDIGSKMHMAAVDPRGQRRNDTPVRTSGTFTQDLDGLADWFKACGVTSVAMESTVYPRRWAWSAMTSTSTPRADGPADQARQVAARAITPRTALRDYAHRRDAMLGLRCGSTFFVPDREAACYTSTFIAPSGDCPERSGCGAQVIVPGHACTTSVIASPSAARLVSRRQGRQAATPRAPHLPRPRLHA